MTMPKMTGDVLAQKMLGIRPDIPIILSTGYNELISEKQARALGIKAFLQKPIQINRLSETISKALAK